MGRIVVSLWIILMFCFSAVVVVGWFEIRDLVGDDLALTLPALISAVMCILSATALFSIISKKPWRHTIVLITLIAYIVESTIVLAGDFYSLHTINPVDVILVAVPTVLAGLQFGRIIDV